MKLRVLPNIYLLMISQVMEVETREVSGFVGENITLNLGYNTSTISTIEWSIFTNHTFIATMRGGKVRVDRIPQFQGRLKLNEINGDLEIRDLKEVDSLRYTAEIRTNDQSRQFEIQLSVKHRLEKPIITDLFNTAKDGFCVIALRCSSPFQGTNVSWESKTSLVSFQRSDGNAKEMIVYFNTKAPLKVKFNCTAVKDSSKAFTSVERTCKQDPIPTPCKECVPDIVICLVFILGVLIGGVLAYMFYDKLKKMVDNCKGR